MNDINIKRKELISFAMFKNKINKVELSKKLGFSYPTMLSKLNNLNTLKISEVDRLCNCLSIDIVEFINPLNV